jgi:hypothetical protein
LEKRLRHAEAARMLGPASPAQLLREAVRREKKRTTSRFLGVSWYTLGKCWRISIQARGKKFDIAWLYDEEEAAAFRDRLMLHLAGKTAVLNFPERKLKPASFDQLQRELRKARFASKYKGVSPQVVAQRQTWAAHIIVRQKTCFLGRYNTERRAALAYDRAAQYYFGAAAKLNLPATSTRHAPAPAAALRAEAHAELKKTKRSRFHGVTGRGATWAARIVHRYQVHPLGSFDSEELAAKAYDKAAPKLHGAKAKLNFHPVTGEELCGQPLRSVEAVAMKTRGRP